MVVKAESDSFKPLYQSYMCWDTLGGSGSVLRKVTGLIPVVMSQVVAGIKLMGTLSSNTV